MKKEFRQLFPKLFGFRASGKKPEAKKEDRRELESVVVLCAGKKGKKIIGQYAAPVFHFHLPVWTSNVVDLMHHPGTDPTVVETLSRFALSIGQIPIMYKREAHGYIFNSMYGAMQRQALDLVIGGVASIEDVDRAWMGIFKMRIGPFGMMDQIGLGNIPKDTGYSA